MSGAPTARLAESWGSGGRARLPHTCPAQHAASCRLRPLQKWVQCGLARQEMGHQALALGHSVTTMCWRLGHVSPLAPACSEPCGVPLPLCVAASATLPLPNPVTACHGKVGGLPFTQEGGHTSDSLWASRRVGWALVPLHSSYGDPTKVTRARHQLSLVDRGLQATQTRSFGTEEGRRNKSR